MEIDSTKVYSSCKVTILMSWLIDSFEYIC